MKIAIAIPARYASTRFPGKPLAMIGGKTMLNRVVNIAREVASHVADVSYFVTTDDKRIAEHAKDIGAPCIMTPESCATGSDRVLSAMRQLDEWPDFVVNLQGDAPFTPVSVVESLIKALKGTERYEVVTPVHQLSWEDLDRLRATKEITAFSGTTVAIDEQGRALWFSKNILPAIRKEEDMRESDEYSPVYQHMGLYGYRVDVLEKFCNLPMGKYEQLEGLEQLRMLENGIKIHTVKVNVDRGHIQSGIDTPEDLERAEAFIAQTEAA